MKWIAKVVPMYFHPKDIWIKEPEYTRWIPNMETQHWELDEEDGLEFEIKKIPFHKKSKILKSYCE